MKKLNALLLAGLSTILSCKKEPASFKVATRPVNEAVYASGEIMPEAYELIKATSSQRILQVLVSQGEQVRKGQILAVLGQPSQNTQLDILNEQLRLARRNASDSSASANIILKLRRAPRLALSRLPPPWLRHRPSLWPLL